MTREEFVPEDQLAPGVVRRLGRWAVGNRDGELFAVSRRCRHQLGDLSAGRLDADGCLVCPWHQSTYDVTTGAMVQGPKGFLGYHGPTPGYTQLVLAYGRKLRIRIGRIHRRGTDVGGGVAPAMTNPPGGPALRIALSGSGGQVDDELLWLAAEDP